jgi:hypothetical protein
MRRSLIAVAVLAALAGCGSAAPSATVPTAPPTSGSSGASNAGASNAGASNAADGSSGAARPAPSVGYSQQRLAQMRAASQCVREHGVPDYQDAVLTGDGHVYTDSRAMEVALGKDGSLEAGLRAACARLFTAAGFAPDDESLAPPALVQAGVRTARCLRAHGMPGMRDPESSTRFTPGHGFGLTNAELPNNGRLGKSDPTVQQALQACRPEIDAEVRASTLAELAGD